MATPDLGKLDLSDSDSEDLFASPTKGSKSQQALTKAPESGTTGSGPVRNGESKYDAEAAREASLQRELEGVRSINEVIEGVVASLETAKGNMDVRQNRGSSRLCSNLPTDGIANSYLSIDTSKYMDPSSVTNRAQSTTHSESQLERR
jgi:hypothetical protein